MFNAHTVIPELVLRELISERGTCLRCDPLGLRGEGSWEQCFGGLSCKRCHHMIPWSAFRFRMETREERDRIEYPDRFKQ